MRILISNPDSIGDLILRQPLCAALAAEGHELMLVVRQFVAPVASVVAPAAQIVHLEVDPYSGTYFAFESPAVQRVIGAAREFAPDVVCIAAYQRTQFDEYLVKSLAGSRSVGFAGTLYRGHISFGLDIQSDVRFDESVVASVDSHELTKNELLCSTLLGRNVSLGRPRIEPGAEQLQAASAKLCHVGLKPQTFWVACVGDNQYTAVRNWRHEHWAEVLATMANRYGDRFVFIGTPDENQTAERILGLMGDQGHLGVNLCCAGDGLDTLLGLTYLSSGYIGRDTGPMHVAAAMDKPVIAVFGGGTWPRFVPAAKNGVVWTVNVPCSGCDWMCHLSESYCVKRVPVNGIIDAVEALRTNPEGSLSVQVLDADELLRARMVREAAENARETERRSAARRRTLETELASLTGELSSIQASYESERSAASAELKALETELANHRAELASLTAELSSAQASFANERSVASAEIKVLEVRRAIELQHMRLEREDWATIQRRSAAQMHVLVQIIQEVKRDMETRPSELANMETRRSEPANMEAQPPEPDIPQSQLSLLGNALRMFRIAAARILAARGRRFAETKGLAGSFLLIFRTRFGPTHKQNR